MTTHPWEWLLQLLEEEMDPIRIQKGMFLFAMEAGAPPEQVYSFVPYNWGPCAFDIYDDLDRLCDEGLVERLPVSGATWHKYRRTSGGDQLANVFLRDHDEGVTAKMKAIRESIRGKSFDGLLRSVYNKYPQFAEKSLFRTRGS